MLNPNSPTPLFVQLKEHLLHGLRSGAWSEDQAIPSERQLTNQFSVSRATVRQAIQELESEGWLVRRQGRGTFSSVGKVEQRLELLAGFSDNMRAQGLEPSSRIITFGLQPATDAVARALSILAGSPIVRIDRVRLVNGEPLLFEASHINEHVVPGLAAQDLTGSLYELLTKHYRVVLATGEETIGASLAEADLAELLEIEEGAPVIYTERTVRTDKNQPIEFTQRWGRADKSSFRVTLSAGNTLIRRKEDPRND